MAGELVFYFVSGPAILNWVEMLAREEIEEAPCVATHLLGLILLATTISSRLSSSGTKGGG
ncbi:hypothetical protein B6V76_19220 [Thioclava sp. IC9]|nr:hypothetical protein [Thioclava sp. NG1]OWX97619.1 hypothetical protein B6V76_19220 [Thioclava sp. IC9]